MVIGHKFDLARYVSYIMMLVNVKNDQNALQAMVWVHLILTGRPRHKESNDKVSVNTDLKINSGFVKIRFTNHEVIGYNMVVVEKG